jgi:hypothetical protein
MLKKTLLVMLFGIGLASITAPAFADIGLFFNDGQQYYGQNYYGLYPYSTPYYYYDPYYRPFYSYDPNYSAPYSYRSYHYHSQYSAGYSSRQCAVRFHTYNPVTQTYVGKGGLPHHCP